jgi:hypothetical protein
MQKNCNRLLVTLVLLSVISFTAQVAYASSVSSTGDDLGGAAVGSLQKPGVGVTSSEPDSPSKTPAPLTRSLSSSSDEGVHGATLRGLDRVRMISRIWAALYLKVIK